MVIVLSVIMIIWIGSLEFLGALLFIIKAYPCRLVVFFCTSVLRVVFVYIYVMCIFVVFEGEESARACVRSFHLIVVAVKENKKRWINQMPHLPCVFVVRCVPIRKTKTRLRASLRSTQQLRTILQDTHVSDHFILHLFICFCAGVQNHSVGCDRWVSTYGGASAGWTSNNKASPLLVHIRQYTV